MNTCDGNHARTIVCLDHECWLEDENPVRVLSRELAEARAALREMATWPEHPRWYRWEKKFAAVIRAAEEEQPCP
jgi:hypothetical protein